MNSRPSISYLTVGAFLAALLFANVAENVAASSKEAPVRPWEQLFSVQCLAGGRCFAAGSKGLLMTSLDGGVTWSRDTVAESPGSRLKQDLDIYCVRLDPHGRKGWIVGEAGLVMRTVDGGLSWVRQASPVGERLFKVALSTADSACAVGVNGNLICTADAGANWQRRRVNDLALYDVTFADPNNGWAAGEYQTILHTADGGRTWRIQHGGIRSSSATPPNFALAFSDAEHGVALGQGGAVLVTANGGTDWRDGGTVAAAQSVFAAVYSGESSAKILWAAGAGGSILQRVPDGHWRAYRALAASDLTDIAVERESGVAVGMNGTILRRQTGDVWIPVAAER
jgi:photosystem II stability/assembly factor-like uncharacterized protein